LFNLYELIVDDLIEHDRYQAAEHVIKAFLYKNIRNMTNYRERLLRMEYIIEHPQEKALHKKVVTEHRKQEIIKQCLFDVHEDVEPSRLMKLLTQAIKYQSNEGVIKPGIKLNLFEGKQKIVQQ
jgi:WD40 repeat-containing protein SMU1